MSPQAKETIKYFTKETWWRILKWLRFNQNPNPKYSLLWAEYFPGIRGPGFLQKSQDKREWDFNFLLAIWIHVFSIYRVWAYYNILTAFGIICLGGKDKNKRKISFSNGMVPPQPTRENCYVVGLLLRLQWCVAGLLLVLFLTFSCPSKTPCPQGVTSSPRSSKIPRSVPVRVLWVSHRP